MRVLHTNFYEQPYTANNNLNIPPKASFYKNLANMGAKKRFIMEGERCLDILSKKKINLKGNRKKAIIILCSFDHDRSIDINKVIKSLGINRNVFNNVTILYEKYINVINYGIKDITHRYLENNNKSNTETLVRNHLIGLSGIHSKQNIYTLLDNVV
jgi:hypothetical protein